jgi:cadmium resistance protein CadD (predicted permease)
MVIGMEWGEMPLIINKVYIFLITSIEENCILYIDYVHHTNLTNLHVQLVSCLIVIFNMELYGKFISTVTVRGALHN